jgi:hypothetical protein
MVNVLLLEPAKSSEFLLQPIIIEFLYSFPVVISNLPQILEIALQPQTNKALS